MLHILIIVMLGYSGVIAALYFAQGWLIFPGTLFSGGETPQGSVAGERITLEVDEGIRLEGTLFRSEGSRDLVVGFGGNAQDAVALGHDLAIRLAGATVAVFHYRGYGPSTGQASEAALLADALAIHDRLTAELMPARVFAVGVSLGSSVATYLSKQRRLDGLILVTPFDSIEAIARENYPWAPVGLLLQHRFRSADFMIGNPTPVAVIAAGEDRVVRPERTRALVKRLDNLVFQAVIEDAAHNTILGFDEYHEAFLDAFEALAKAKTPALEVPGAASEQPLDSPVGPARPTAAGAD
jgi:pimeloyl-ACP methyl ester carboxylesterase